MCVISSSELQVPSVAKAASFMLTLPSVSRYISSNPVSLRQKLLDFLCVVTTICRAYNVLVFINLVFVNMGLSIDDVL